MLMYLFSKSISDLNPQFYSLYLKDNFSLCLGISEPKTLNWAKNYNVKIVISKVVMQWGSGSFVDINIFVRKYCFIRFFSYSLFFITLNQELHKCQDPKKDNR